MISHSMFRFDGQVALVTGAGNREGIGFATARILGQLGAQVALVATTDRIYDRAEELESLGIAAKGYIADLMKEEEVEGLVQQILGDFSGIHVLINNAGMTQVGQPESFADFLHTSSESWEQELRRNVTIPFFVTQKVLPHMIKQGYGRIVNTSSVTGPLVSNPGEAGYSAAKAAVVGMSKALALEVGSHGITVNNVLPGWIATSSQTESEAAGGENTPLKRSGTPEEVAHAMVFLASREASYITGASLVVDGGNILQEYKGPPENYY